MAEGRPLWRSWTRRKSWRLQARRRLRRRCGGRSIACSMFRRRTRRSFCEVEENTATAWVRACPAALPDDGSRADAAAAMEEIVLRREVDGDLPRLLREEGLAILVGDEPPDNLPFMMNNDEGSSERCSRMVLKYLSAMEMQATGAIATRERGLDDFAALPWEHENCGDVRVADVGSMLFQKSPYLNCLTPQKMWMNRLKIKFFEG